MDGPCTVRLVVSTILRTILLVDTDARTIELVQKAVRCLNDALPLEVFSDPNAVRQYLLDTKRRPGAIVLNGEREGTLTLMSWINNATFEDGFRVERSTDAGAAWMSRYTPRRMRQPEA